MWHGTAHAAAALQQRTPAWHAARRGKLTASNVSAALGLSPYISRKTAFRRAMGLDKKFVDNNATRWGAANEQNGVLAYKKTTGNAVEATGLHVHPTIAWLAGSPDGLVGTDGLLEVKCPYNGNAIYSSVPLHYYLQMHVCLEVTGRAWCDYISWSPASYIIYRIRRDNGLHKKLLPYYRVFHEAMQRKAHAPPVLTDEDNAFIRAAVAESAERCVDKSKWGPRRITP
tara:strand:- start:44 stop:727 length:684 start_codon:yes stop_codon:yes gene_type:complete